MSSATLRHYKTTLAYTNRDRDLRIREMKQRFRTRVSRRRVKQSIRETLHRLSLN